MQEHENVRSSNLHPVVQICRLVHNIIQRTYALEYKHSRNSTEACSPVESDKRGVEEIEPENGQNHMVKVQQRQA
jgi:hypothetical protein